MSKLKGIIYGTQALFRWSSAYPNGRLIVVGSVMFALLVLAKKYPRIYPRDQPAQTFCRDES